jgi:uncharacterized protein YukE
MTAFYVNHGAHEEATGILQSAVSGMGTILEDLNNFLRSMSEATQGQAAPLWAEQQRKWTTDYGIMQQNLGSGASATASIGDIFLEGDRTGARIMI